MIAPSALFLFSCLLAPPTSAQSELLVTSRLTDQVLRYDVSSGAFLGVFASAGGLDNPVGGGDQVRLYDGHTGAHRDSLFARGAPQLRLGHARWPTPPTPRS